VQSNIEGTEFPHLQGALLCFAIHILDNHSFYQFHVTFSPSLFTPFNLFKGSVSRDGSGIFDMMNCSRPGLEPELVFELL